jgi:hypothetical protein
LSKRSPEPGRADKGTAFLILSISGLLADQHDPGVSRPFGRVLPQLALAARRSFGSQAIDLGPNLLSASPTLMA